MHIYFLIDGSDCSESRDDIVSAMTGWLEESRSSAKLINDEGAEQLGLSIETQRAKTLAKPLMFLYGLAREYEQEFVVGYVGEQDEREDVCYFGFEEGKPEVDEIMMYLGL